MSSPDAGRVLALVDDAAGAAAALDTCCVLAQLMRRELQLVFVENTAALAAAELSVTRVLAQAGLAWTPFAAADVERGWRAQAARLRALAMQASAPRAVPWSLRVARGSVREIALGLLAEPDADLLFVAAASNVTLQAHRRAARRRVDVFDDDSPAGRQALEVARRLADALAARLQVRRIGGAIASLSTSADFVVLPSGLLAPPMLTALRVPALLVGQAR